MRLIRKAPEEAEKLQSVQGKLRDRNKPGCLSGDRWPARLSGAVKLALHALRRTGASDVTMRLVVTMMPSAGRRPGSANGVVISTGWRFL